MTTELTLKTKLESITKVYPLALPEEPLLPAIIYQRISTAPQRNNRDKFDAMRFQLRIVGKKYLDVLDIANQIEDLIDLNDTDFKFSDEENRFDIKETDTGLFTTVLEFMIWN